MVTCAKRFADNVKLKRVVGRYKWMRELLQLNGPHISYCSPVWSPTAVGSTHEIETVQRLKLPPGRSFAAISEPRGAYINPFVTFPKYVYPMR